jgi:hypothetical protein
MRVYQLVRCPLLSRNSLTTAGFDPIFGNVHRKINTRLLGKLVKCAQDDNNTMDSHSHVPEELQAEIRMEDQQRHDRKRKAGASSPSGFPPIHITNVMPGQSEKVELQHRLHKR